MQRKLIITAALTGNVPTKEKNPHTPVTPDEIAADVDRCHGAGAALFHLHARDADQKPTLDTTIYSEIMEKAGRAAPNAIIQLSTGARAGREWEDRAGPVRLLPEMASFTTGSNNMPGIIYENAPPFIDFLAGVFKETGVKPEIEVFDSGMIANALFLVKKGYLTTPLHFNFVMGVPGAQPGTVRGLSFLVDSLPSDATWTVSGIGRSQMPLAAAAIAMGGHVRVGLEDSMVLPGGELATNEALVRRVADMAKLVGREIANPDEARNILSLHGG